MGQTLTWGPDFLASTPSAGVIIAFLLFVVVPAGAIWFGIKYRRSL